MSERVGRVLVVVLSAELQLAASSHDKIHNLPSDYFLASLFASLFLVTTILGTSQSPPEKATAKREKRKNFFPPHPSY
jgi:hypothetical protein